jgi:hypothetical protein
MRMCAWAFASEKPVSGGLQAAKEIRAARLAADWAAR